MAIITISRGTFGGVKEMAECLSSNLGYRLMTREELLSCTAKAFGATEGQLESALLHRPGFLEGRGLRRLRYINCVQAAIAKEVRADNIVYHGQAGHLLLKGLPHHLRVRVVANMEFRIESVVERCNMTRERAVEYIRELDQERDNWVRWVYGIDSNDPSTYDMVINLEHIPVPTACQVVAETARREFQTTPEAQQKADDLALASEIRARMGMDKSVSDDRFVVSAEKGVVTINCDARRLPEAEYVKAMALEIEGVKQVELR
jgi:osmotically-inducible protein OsmY